MENSQKNKFLNKLIYGASVFSYQYMFRGKYVDRVWGYHPAEAPFQMDCSKNNFKRQKIDIAWGYHSSETFPNGPQNLIILYSLN